MKTITCISFILFNILCHAQARENYNVKKEKDHSIFNKKKMMREEAANLKNVEHARIYNFKISVLQEYKSSIARVILKGKINLYEHINLEQIRSTIFLVRDFVPEESIQKTFVVSKVSETPKKFYGIFSYSTFKKHFIPMISDNQRILAKAQRLDRYNFYDELYSLIEEYNK